MKIRLSISRTFSISDLFPFPDESLILRVAYNREMDYGSVAQKLHKRGSICREATIPGVSCRGDS